MQDVEECLTRPMTLGLLRREARPLRYTQSDYDALLKLAGDRRLLRRRIDHTDDGTSAPLFRVRPA
jgi:hypothetical protein